MDLFKKFDEPRVAVASLEILFILGTFAVVRKKNMLGASQLSMQRGINGYTIDATRNGDVR